jgi:hypothetical protein
MKRKKSMLAVIILMNRKLKILVYFAMLFPAGGRGVQWTDVFPPKTFGGRDGVPEKNREFTRI